MPAEADVALVTGSSRGIGRAVARALGRQGHRVVLTARDPAALATVAAELAADGIACAAHAADLQDPAARAGLLAFAQDRFGPIDVLVNNAGTAPSARLEQTSDADLDAVLALHVRAPFALLRACLPTMLQRGRGCVVQLASTAGLRGFAFTAAYTAAKHGMVGLSRAAAVELQRTPVRVYAVCPGFVDTDITRQAAARVAQRGNTPVEQVFARLAAQNRIGRMHSADEVAAAVLQLVRERPAGCVFDLDRQPPSFVD